MRTMEAVHSAWCQNLRYGKYALFTVRQVSPGTMQSQSVRMTCTIQIPQKKAVGNVSMMVRILISARADFVILNFSFELCTILWAFDKHKFLMLTLLGVRRSVRYLRFPLKKTFLELNFNTRGTA